MQDRWLLYKPRVVQAPSVAVNLSFSFFSGTSEGYIYAYILTDCHVLCTALHGPGSLTVLACRCLGRTAGCLEKNCVFAISRQCPSPSTIQVPLASLPGFALFGDFWCVSTYEELEGTVAQDSTSVFVRYGMYSNTCAIAYSVTRIWQRI